MSRQFGWTAPSKARGRELFGIRLGVLIERVLNPVVVEGRHKPRARLHRQPLAQKRVRVRGLFDIDAHGAFRRGEWAQNVDDLHRDMIFDAGAPVLLRLGRIGLDVRHFKQSGVGVAEEGEFLGVDRRLGDHHRPFRRVMLPAVHRRNVDALAAVRRLDKNPLRLLLGMGGEREGHGRQGGEGGGLPQKSGHASRSYCRCRIKMSKRSR